MAGVSECQRCGFAIPVGDRFCQRCGAPAPVAPGPVAPVAPAASLPPAAPAAAPAPPVTPAAPAPSVTLPGALIGPPPGPERTLGHLPAEWVSGETGLFGRPRTPMVNLVVTSTRVLCLAETPESNDAWVAESERLDDLARGTGVPLRALIDGYDFAAPVFRFFWESTPDVLLAEDRGNWSLPLAGVAGATIALDADLDGLVLTMDNGQEFRFRLYNSTGLAAARLFASVLGPQRVRVQG